MSDICDICGGYAKHDQPGGCTCPRGLPTGEMKVPVCMFTYRGSRWFGSHEEAVKAIREEYPEATRVKRWQENHLQYEDYKDSDGFALVMLEFAGPPVLAIGFNYE